MTAAKKVRSRSQHFLSCTAGKEGDETIEGKKGDNLLLSAFLRHRRKHRNEPNRKLICVCILRAVKVAHVRKHK